MELFKSAMGWLLSINWEGIFKTIRSIFIFLDIVLVAGLVFVFLKALEYRPKFYLHPERKLKKKGIKNQEIAKRWQVLKEKAASNPPQSFVWAIVEADKFVDKVLINELGLSGEHMADRLERLSSWDLKSLDNLWRAHKIRNELVHQPDYDINPRDAEEVLKLYEDFLKELEII
jgi:hypothetical protein